MSNNNYVRTDLAAECPALEQQGETEGISLSKEEHNGITVTTVKVLSEAGERVIGKPVGTYVTLSFGNILDLPDTVYPRLVALFADKLTQTALSLLGGVSPQSVLVAGLGNRDITPDAVGPLTVKGITVTRHIKKCDSRLFSALKKKSISAISPGVIGQTGIETLDTVKGAVQNVNPDLVVVIDALASKSVDRMGSTLQICDSGISPGSGIGNRRQAISKESLGIPVIAVGVPTTVSSSTLVFDALEKAGISTVSDELTAVLDNGKSFFVTLNESDALINSLAKLIADGINQAFSLR